MRRRRKPTDDPDYLDWIRTLPCIVCQTKGERQTTPTTAHHHGPRAYSARVSDRRAIPLCFERHHLFGPAAVHVLGRRFEEYHEIDADELIRTLNESYERQL